MSESASPARHKWRELVRRQQVSGLSAAVFCRREGLAESSFFTWKRRLGPSPATPAFVEATVADRSSPGVQSAGRIEVRLRGGRWVRISRRGFDRELLVELVAVLEGLPSRPEGLPSTVEARR